MRLGRGYPTTKTHSYLRPPQVVVPPPTQQMQTVLVWTLDPAQKQRLRQAIRTRSRLFPPAASAPSIPPVETTLNITLVRQPRRGAQRALGPPIVTTPFVPPGAPYAVTTLKRVLVPRRQDWRRQVMKVLFAPAVVNLPRPVETRVRVKYVSPVERRLRSARQFHPHLFAPAVVGPYVPPSPGVAGFRTLMGVGQ